MRTREPGCLVLIRLIRAAAAVALLSVMIAAAADAPAGAVTRTYQPTDTALPTSGFVAATLVDLTGDELLDSVSWTSATCSSCTSGFQDMLITVGVAQADGTFAVHQQTLPLPAPVAASVAGPSIVQPVDFNGDGNMDVLVRANASGMKLALLPGDGLGGFLAPYVLLNASNALGAAGDFNHDGRQDLLYHDIDPDDSSLRAWFVALGNGPGTVDTPTRLGAPSFAPPMFTDVADVDGDGALDIVTTEQNQVALDVIRAVDVTAALASGPLVIHRSSIATNRQRFLDINGDGRDDLVSRVASTYSEIFVAFANADGTFAAPAMTGVSAVALVPFQPPGARAATAGVWTNGDVDGDSRDDLIADLNDYSNGPPPGQLTGWGSLSVFHLAGSSYAVDALADPQGGVFTRTYLAAIHDQGLAPGAEIVLIGTQSSSGALVDRTLVASSASDDGDGIDANVDPEPTTFSSIATDGTTTLIDLVRGGLAVHVADAPSPLGLHVTASGTGGPATATICGDVVTFTAGDDAIFTCGSLAVSVIAGPIEIALGGGAGLTVLTGASIKIDDPTTENPSVTVFEGSATLTNAAGQTTTLTADTPAVLCAGRVATIVGTAGNDNLTGTRNVDVIVGMGGNDRIEAGAGDFVCGGDGDDTLTGVSGAATLRGGAGNDRITGGSVNDAIDGGDGNDKIDAGSGNDTIDAGAGNDAVDTGSGDDRLVGGDGNDQLVAGSGNDVLIGGLGDDTLDAGTGNDSLDGGGGSDRCLGGSGTNTLTACERTS